MFFKHDVDPNQHLVMILLKPTSATPPPSSSVSPRTQIRSRPNRFSALLTTFNQSSIKTATFLPRAGPEVKYVRCGGLLSPSADRRPKRGSVCSYLHLTLLSNQPAHERETRTPPNCCVQVRGAGQ